MEHPGESFRLRFNPTIDLGSIATAVIMLGAVIGWALIGYESVNKQLDAQTAEIKLIEQRLTNDETAAKQQTDDQRASMTEIRTFLAKIDDQLSGVRVLVASQGARDGTHH